MKLTGKQTKEFYMYRINARGEIVRIKKGTFKALSEDAMLGWHFYDNPAAGYEADMQYDIVALARGVLATTKQPYCMNEGWTVLRVETGEVVGWIVQRDSLTFDPAMVTKMSDIVNEMRGGLSVEAYDRKIKSLEMQKA